MARFESDGDEADGINLLSMGRVHIRAACIRLIQNYVVDLRLYALLVELNHRALLMGGYDAATISVVYSNKYVIQIPYILQYTETFVVVYSLFFCIGNWYLVFILFCRMLRS